MQHDPEPLYPKAMEMPHLTMSVSERDHIQGSATAAVTLVEYGDYECPYCALAYPVVKEIQRQLGLTLRFVFRHFPLTQIHTHARHAAEAAEGASVQDKFWNMHDLLFEHQDALDDEHLLHYAATLGLDTERFKWELQNHVFAYRVNEDTERHHPDLCVKTRRKERGKESRPTLSLHTRREQKNAAQASHKSSGK